MTDITNFNISSNAQLEDELDESSRDVHIRVKKTRGRKCVTTLENLEVIDEDPVRWKDIFKDFRKKVCHCNGSLDEEEKTILLFGDQRAKVQKYLVDKKLVKEDNIKIHGF